MPQYRILVIAHSLKNNAVAKHNSVVDETQLTAPAEQLIKAGFIELVGVNEVEVVEEKVVKAPKPKLKK
jgi:hypothetical protein